MTNPYESPRSTPAQKVERTTLKRLLKIGGITTGVTVAAAALLFGADYAHMKLQPKAVPAKNPSPLPDSPPVALEKDFGEELDAIE